jgi:hypothetical protein
MSHHLSPNFRLRAVFAFALLTATPPWARAEAVDPIVGKWNWFDKSTKIFLANGETTGPKGKAYATWRCENPGGEPRRYVITYQNGKWVDHLRLLRERTFLDGTNNTNTHVTATRIGPAPALSSAEPERTPPSSPSLASSSPRSRIALFSEGLPRAQQWAFVPLRTPVPAEVRQIFETLVTNLRGEATTTPQATPLAYELAGRIGSSLTVAFDERAAYLARSRQYANGLITDAWEDDWVKRSAVYRTGLEALRTQLSEAIRTSPAPARPPAATSSEVPEFPSIPAPTPPPKAKPKPESDAIHVSGKGPSGTNFGGGGRVLKMSASVTTESEKPLPVAVDCYWVGWDGKHHTTGAVGHRGGVISAGKPLEFELVDPDWGRNDGSMRGITKGDLGMYRGWLVVVHSKGKRVGSASNMPEFHHLVP